MSIRPAYLAVLLAAAILPACTSSDEDGRDDSFAGGGKADGGLSDAEIAGVLKVANEADASTLIDGVGLTSRVANNLVDHRAGSDGKLGTADDDNFDDLAELDAIPYVGQKALDALLAYAKAHGYVQGGGGGFTELCKSQHAGTTPNGDGVDICDELYDSPPYVHLPQDQISGDKVTRYGAIVRGVGALLYTADGKISTLNLTGGFLALKPPTNLFTIYEVTGTKTTEGTYDTITVSAIKPIGWVPGALQDKLLLGTWEAQASERIGTNSYDETKPVTVRYTLTSTTPAGVWSHYPGMDGLIAAGTIENFNTSVTGSDGSCLPSITGLGAKSPFYMATVNKITTWRHPNMHGLNDQVAVVDYPPSAELSPNGMGNIDGISLAGFVSRTGPDLEHMEILPHSTPNGHKMWGFKRVTSGGAPCTP